MNECCFQYLDKIWQLLENVKYVISFLNDQLLTIDTPMTRPWEQAMSCILWVQSRVCVDRIHRSDAWNIMLLCDAL